VQLPLDLAKPLKTNGFQWFLRFRRSHFCFLSNLKNQPKRHPKWSPKSDKSHEKGGRKRDPKKAHKNYEK
jgi:hypothetical protein